MSYQDAGQFKVTISIERRPDGGVRVYSDDMPELVLSGRDVASVLRDIVPAVETILGARMGCEVRASWLWPYREASKAASPRQVVSTPPRVELPSALGALFRQARHLELAAACG